MLATFFFLALYLQRVLGYTAIENSLAFLPISVAVIPAAGLASQLVNHFGFKPLLVAGFALIAGALMWLVQVEVGGGYVSSLLGPDLIAGAGLGTTLVSVVTAATHDLNLDESGLASGLVNTTNQVGGALGLAMLSTIAFARVGAARDALVDALESTLDRREKRLGS